MEWQELKTSHTLNELLLTTSYVFENINCKTNYKYHLPQITEVSKEAEIAQNQKHKLLQINPGVTLEICYKTMQIITVFVQFQL